MSRANELLLVKAFNGKPLFSSQLDLVKDLITLEGSPYFIPQNDVEKRQKEFNRLKTYISQLLSTTVSRSVSEDFKSGLSVAVRGRIKDDSLALKIVNAVISDLKLKKVAPSKADQKSTPIEQFEMDLESARYVAVITMRPLQLDVPKPGVFSIRHYLYNDLIERLEDPGRDLRQYRFNFPNEAYSLLFWRGFRRVLKDWLDKGLQDVSKHALLDSLFEKFLISENTQLKLVDTDSTAEQLESLTNEVLESLNHNRYLMVFVSSAPIFSLPIVVMDPSEPNNIKVYAVFENDKGTPAVLKYPEGEVGLWRVFMWDQFKLHRNLTKESKFLDSIEG